MSVIQVLVLTRPQTCTISVVGAVVYPRPQNRPKCLLRQIKFPLYTNQDNHQAGKRNLSAIFGSPPVSGVSTSEAACKVKFSGPRFQVQWIMLWVTL